MGETEPSTRLRHASKASQKSCDDTSSSSSSDSSSLPMPTPPDGGWGWVIVAAAFVANLITDGVAFSFGVLLLELLDHFQDSHSKTSWIGSVFLAMPLLAGPIASAFINKFGCRWTCMAGGVLATIGCVISMFATTSAYLCLTFGVMSGLGLSFVYTPAVVIVAFYFEKRRAFATGLSVSGSGIGTFAIAPLMEVFIKTYGWRGTFLILAGLFLNIVVCGALFRPLETSSERKRRKFLQSLDKLSRNNSLATFGVDEETEKQIELTFDGRRYSSTVIRIKKQLDEPVTHSLVQLPTYLSNEREIPTRKGSVSDTQVSSKPKVSLANSNSFRTSEKVELNGRNIVQSKTAETLLGNGSVPHKENSGNGNCTAPCSSPADEASEEDEPNSNLNSVPHLELKSHSMEDLQLLPRSNGQIPTTSASEKPLNMLKHSGTIPRQSRQKHSNLEQFLPMYRRDIFYRGSLIRLDEFIQKKSSSCPQLYKGSETTSDDEESDHVCRCIKWKHAKRVIKEMLDISIFRSVKYTLFFFSNFILYTWYDVPYFYLPDYAQRIGIGHQEASIIVAVIGIANMIGQIAFGIIADHPKVNCSLMYGVSMIICGISNLFYPICTSFVSICIASVIFGFFIGANYSLCSIIIVEVLSLDELTNAYGIMMCGQGVANLIGPPIAGFFFDYTGSYFTTFFCAGGFIILSGLMLFVVTVIQLRSGRRIEKCRKAEEGSSVEDGGIDERLMENIANSNEDG